MKSKLIIGALIGLAALPAAKPDVVWPTEWTAFGPDTIQRIATSDKCRDKGPPVTADLLAGEVLQTIPADLMIGTNRFQGQKVRLTADGLDLMTLVPAAERNLPRPPNARTVYLLAPVTAAADTTIQIGAGAYWWMQWWLDGRPVFNTLGGGGNGIKPTGRDFVFDVTLSRGEHVLAVAVIGVCCGDLRGFSVAVSSPQELRAWPLNFRNVMNNGRRKYLPIHWSTPINYAAARTDFQRALALANTDEERAEARLALAENYLSDIWGASAANVAAARREYTAVLNLPGAVAGAKARATLGLGEVRLLENDGAGAREEFARALSLSKQFGWTNAVRLALARAYMQERNTVAARQELTQVLAITNLDRGPRFDARILLAALEVTPRIRPDHPRLFFNTDTWPGIKAQVLANTNAFQKLQEEVAALPEQFEARDWGSPYWFKVGDTWHKYPDLMTAALVYRVTGDPALLARISKMLRATIDQYLLLVDNNAGVVPRINWLAALDWVWNDLPPAERDSLASDFLRFAYGWHVQDRFQGVQQADRDPYYYQPNMHWYAGLVTFSPALGPADYLRALTVLGRGYDNNVAASFGMRIERMKDRGMVTRVDYAFNDLPTPSWAFMHSWRAAVGQLPDEWAFASGIAPSCVLRNMLGFDRYRYRDFGYANSWRPKGGWQSGSLLYDNLGQFMHFFSKSQPEEAAIAAWLRQQMKGAGGGGEGHYVIDPYLLNLAGAPLPKLPEELPLARCYPTNGLVLMSSGFDTSNSTYALYSCGGGVASAEQFDTGHFTIFKRGYLALDSGTRALMQPDPIPGANYDRQSVAHNTVLIRMPGETFGPAVKSNSGGQRLLPSSAKLLAFETSKFFAYAATDATPTYHTNKCAQMVRQFIYLPPDHFVVFDRVVAKDASYPKAWLLHTGNEPSVTEKTFRADQGHGRLFCCTLLPADAILEKIGGPGKEFWTDGRNWPIPAHSQYLVSYMGMTNAADVPENVGRWRVEVKPGAARTDDVFLHLIQVSDQTVEQMVASKLSEKDDQVTLAFNVGPRAYAITLNKTGAVGGHIRIEESGKALVDQDLTQKIQPQFGLALEQKTADQQLPVNAGK